MEFNLPTYKEHLNEKVETLETQVSFDTDNQLKLLILRHLNMAEIPTGAIKVEQNSVVKKTYIRIFSMAVDDIKALLVDEKIASKITISDSSRDVEPEFNT